MQRIARRLRPERQAQWKTSPWLELCEHKNEIIFEKFQFQPACVLSHAVWHPGVFVFNMHFCVLFKRHLEDVLLSIKQGSKNTVVIEVVIVVVMLFVLFLWSKTLQKFEENTLCKNTYASVSSLDV